MLRFIQTDPAKNGWKLSALDLWLGGISFGLGVASKWIVIYHAAALACFFVFRFGKTGLTWVRAGAALDQSKKGSGGGKKHNKAKKESSDASEDQSPYIIRTHFPRWAGKTLVTAFFAFLVVPLVIYVLAYIPYMSVNGTGLEGIVENQQSMYNYHSTLDATHPYSSMWYEWPYMKKPIWYYSGADSMPQDTVSTIIAFGNPVVWYLGSLCFLLLLGVAAVVFFRWLWRGKGHENTSIPLSPRSMAPWAGEVLFFIVIGGLAQYMPWAVIPRKLVFIYHFFATVPFIVLAEVWILRLASERFSLANAKLRWVLPAIVIAVALGLFAFFLPVLGGIPVPRFWPEMIKTVMPWGIYF